MQKITFTECQKYLTQHQAELLAQNIVGDRVPEYLAEEEYAQSVFIGIKQNRQVVLIPQEGSVRHFDFEGNSEVQGDTVLEKHEVRELYPTHRFAIYKLDPYAFLAWLRSEEEATESEEEDIGQDEFENDYEREEQELPKKEKTTPYTKSSTSKIIPPTQELATQSKPLPITKTMLKPSGTQPVAKSSETKTIPKTSPTKAIVPSNNQDEISSMDEEVIASTNIPPDFNDIKEPALAEAQIDEAPLDEIQENQSDDTAGDSSAVPDFLGDAFDPTKLGKDANVDYISVSGIKAVTDTTDSTTPSIDTTASSVPPLDEEPTANTVDEAIEAQEMIPSSLTEAPVQKTMQTGPATAETKEDRYTIREEIPEAKTPGTFDFEDDYNDAKSVLISSVVTDDRTPFAAAPTQEYSGLQGYKPRVAVLTPEREYEDFKRSIWIAIITFIIGMPILGGIVWGYHYVYNEYKLWQHRRYLVETHLAHFEQYLHDMQSILKEVESNLTLINQNFPADQGYPEPNPELLATVEEIHKHLEEVTATREKISNLFQQKTQLAYEYIIAEEAQRIYNLTKTSVTSDLPPVYLPPLQQINTRVQNILKTAQFIATQKKQDKQIRDALMGLRDQMVTLDQKNKALEENWNLVQQKYISKEYPPVPDDTNSLIQGAKQQIRELRKSLRSLEDAMIKNVPLALELSGQFASIKIDTSKLDARRKGLLDHVAACEKIIFEAKQQRETYQMLQQLDNLIAESQPLLEKIEVGGKELDQYPKEWNFPRPDHQENSFLTSTKQKIEELQSSLEKSRPLFYNKQFTESQAMLKPWMEQYEASKKMVVQLKSLNINLANAVMIARNMQYNRELSLKIANLLPKVQDKQTNLEVATRQMEEYLAIIARDYPPTSFPAVKIDYQKTLRYSQQIRDNLKRSLDRAKQLLQAPTSNNQQAQQNAELAFQELSKQEGNIQHSARLTIEMSVLLEKFKQELVELEKLAVERRTLAQINEKKSKIQGYLRELQDPLKKLNAVAKDHPQTIQQYLSDYKTISGHDSPINPTALDSGLTTILSHTLDRENKIKEILSQGETLVQSKSYDQVSQLWDPIEQQTLLNRDAISAVSNAAEQASNDLASLRKMLDDILRKEKLKAMVVQLKERKKKIEEAVKQINTISEQINAYPIQEGYLSVDTNTNQKSLDDADFEIQDLNRLVEKATGLQEIGKYEEAIKALVDTVDERATQLPIILGTVQNLRRLAAENNIRKEKQPYYKDLYQQTKTWAQQPFGSWQPKVIQIVELYDSISKTMKSKLSNSDFDNFNNAMNRLRDWKILDKDSALPIDKMDRIPKVRLDKAMWILEKELGANIPQLIEKKREAAITFSQKEECELAKKYYEQHTLDFEDCNTSANTVYEGLKKFQENPTSINSDSAREVRSVAQQMVRKFNDAYQKLEGTFYQFDADLRSNKKQ